MVGARRVCDTMPDHARPVAVHVFRQPTDLRSARSWSVSVLDLRKTERVGETVWRMRECMVRSVPRANLEDVVVIVRVGLGSATRFVSANCGANTRLPVRGHGSTVHVCEVGQGACGCLQCL